VVRIHLPEEAAAEVVTPKATATDRSYPPRPPHLVPASSRVSHLQVSNSPIPTLSHLSGLPQSSKLSSSDLCKGRLANGPTPTSSQWAHSRYPYTRNLSNSSSRDRISPVNRTPNNRNSIISQRGHISIRPSGVGKARFPRPRPPKLRLITALQHSPSKPPLRQMKLPPQGQLGSHLRS